MQERIECVIRGRVQMVLFRDFAKRKADELGLVGSVQNMPDGSVNVAAEGEEEKLKQFIELLKKGPLLARVDDVLVKWPEPQSKFHNFQIIF
ncbi:MAG: acylphosphatase [Patescibacteria group bacterium]